MKTLAFADGLGLPLAAVTQKFAFLGQSGGGKTYSATKLAELMLEVGAQVVALDPVGVWWGLRSSADGKKDGFAITVFGGEHGDLPLTPESGGLMASVLVEKQISAVLDVSEFTTAETKRFVRDFAEAFFQAKKKSKSPVHVFWEEAQTFAPQTPEKDEGVMLNRVERLLKLGRNYGVGWSLITQQPQAVHKRVLNQAGTVLAHRTIGSHEKKAIIAWVSDKVTKAEELSLVDTLPGLDTGMAHLWSPSFLKVSRTVKVNRKLTFDSSATPEFGEEFVEPKRLAAVDVAKLRESLKSMVEDAEKADPDFLKRRILQLEGELKGRPTETKVQIKEVVKEVPVLTEKQLKRLEKAAEKLAGAAADTKDAAQSIARSIGRPHAEPAMPAFNPHEVIGPGLYPPHNPMPRAPEPRLLPESVKKALAQYVRPGPQAIGDVTIKKGAKEMLIALSARPGAWTTRPQLATLVGMAVSGGTFADYLSALRRAGLVEENAQSLKISASGMQFLGPAARSAPASTHELVSMWSRNLKAGARKMLNVLVASYPSWMTREELAEMVEMEVSGGTFADYLSSLRRAGLIDEEHHATMRASDILFPGEGRRA